MKKVVSIILTFVMMAVCFSLPVSALNTEEVFSGFNSPVLFDANINHKEIAEETLSDYVSLPELKSVLIEGISECQARIDISSFSITLTDDTTDAICNYVWYGIPEAFSVYTIGFSYNTVSMKISKMIVGYRAFSDTAAEYKTCMNAIESSGDRLLAGIEGNDSLTDEQKALLIHDRLALWNEYDYSATLPIESYTVYGALGKRASVCQGYAMAYMYLLNRVGIENYYCSSKSLNHGWNIVYIGGNPYHVDVTWDDVSWGNGSGDRGAVGIVGHENFLRSSAGIYATGHEATDYDTTPNDTTYDNCFWQNSEAAFQLLDNEIYYIDNVEESLKRYSDQESLCSVDDTWKYNVNSYQYIDWGNNARLSNDGESLLYSLADSVYKYDVSTGKSQKVYSAELAANFSIYGFVFEDGYLVCDINDFAPYTAYGCENVYQEKVPYTAEIPTDEYISGDSSGDGMVDNIDLGLIMQCINGWEVAINTDISDVDKSGNIDNIDYGLVMQFVNGWEVVLK